MDQVILQLEYRDEYEQLDAVDKRILFSDPIPFYEKIKECVDHSSRRQTGRFRMETIFPAKKDGICDCGCGQKLTGRQRRWASKDCEKFTVSVYWIFYGDVDLVKSLLFRLHGNACYCCGEVTWNLHLDHIIPVFKGGGGCWISNFQLLCVDCHKAKTKVDVSIGRISTPDRSNQLKLAI